MTDKNGKRIPGGGGQNVADRWIQPDYTTYELVRNCLTPHYDVGPSHGTRILTYPIKVPAGTERLKLTFAINRTRTFEFTVPPNAGLSAH